MSYLIVVTFTNQGKQFRLGFLISDVNFSIKLKNGTLSSFILKALNRKQKFHFYGYKFELLQKILV